MKSLKIQDYKKNIYHVKSQDRLNVKIQAAEWYVSHSRDQYDTGMKFLGLF